MKALCSALYKLFQNKEIDEFSINSQPLLLLLLKFI